MIRLVRVLWIIFLNRKLIKRAEEEAKRFMREEKGFLYSYSAEDVDEVIEGTVTLGRLSELLDMKPKKLRTEFKNFDSLLRLYDKKS